MSKRRIVKKSKKSVDDASYKCEKCNTSFSEQRYLTRHQGTNINCDKGYPCLKCKKVFRTPTLLKKHSNRKTNCAPNEVPVIIGNNEENKCLMCGVCCGTKGALTNHVKACLEKTDKLKLLELVEKQGRQLAQVNQGTTVNINNTVNVQQNNMNFNVVVCGYGQEDLSKLNMSYIKELVMDNAEDFIPNMIKNIHDNPDHPEYKNIFYDLVSGKAIVFMENNQKATWYSKKMQEVAKEMAIKIKGHVINNQELNSLFSTAEDDADWNVFADNIHRIHNIDPNDEELIDQTKEALPLRPSEFSSQVIAIEN